MPVALLPRICARLLGLPLLMGFAVVAVAQPQVIPLWPDGAPGSESWTQREQEGRNPGDGTRIVRNVTEPTLTAHLPDPAVANGTAVIVAPGGAFHFLSMDTEGTQVAEWLNERGVAAFVLRYRLVATPVADADFWMQLGQAFSDRPRLIAAMDEVQPLAVADGLQAVRLVRRNAADWSLEPDRIGFMGFSAGGMVAFGVALGYDAESRPDFVAPIYGAPAPVAAVPADAPPLFQVTASDDPLVSPLNVVDYYAAWKNAGIPAELHVYEKGGHGFGMKKQNLPIDGWIDRFGEWLQARGLLASPE